MMNFTHTGQIKVQTTHTEQNRNIIHWKLEISHRVKSTCAIQKDNKILSLILRSLTKNITSYKCKIVLMLSSSVIYNTSLLSVKCLVGNLTSFFFYFSSYYYPQVTISIAIFYLLYLVIM